MALFVYCKWEHCMSIEIAYFTKASLTKANNLAIKHNLNRMLSPDMVKQLPTGYRFPISSIITHSDHVRACIVLNEEGLTAWLDMPWEIYEKLPRIAAEQRTLH
jgi:hypothetical protein